MRILPHKHNTGGFFVAVLEKVDFLPWESKRSITKSLPVEADTVAEGDSKENKTEEAEASKESSRASPPRKKQRFGNAFKEDPFIFFDENEPSWPGIK